MKYLTRLLSMVLCVAALSLSGCSDKEFEMQTGYYTAEATWYDEYGWKEFITIYISNDQIVTVEYNAKNASGFIRSWDMDYMRTSNAAYGSYPSQYARAYSVALLNRQNPYGIDAISGASTSQQSFQLLAEAAINQAKNGDKKIAYVELPNRD